MDSEQTQKIRVLIADDSFFVRTYLSELLRNDPAFEVVGTASSGDEVVDLARHLKPDVITMDYHMPGQNGIEATAAIMLGDRPLPAIIILSAFAGEDGERVRKSLKASGAHIIAKPSGEVSLDLEDVAGEIMRQVKAIGFVQVKSRNAYTRIHEKNIKHTPHQGHGNKHTGSIGVLVIGASTGGPPLVEHLLLALDPDAGIAIVVVQHMSAYFTQLFAERLNRVTRFRVREAKVGDTLVPGVALVVPGGHALVPLKETREGFCAFTIAQTPEHTQEVEIDNTMIAIASCFHGRIAGALLSGMGKDGTRGLSAIHEHGGLALAQDPETATVSAMPRHAIREMGGEVVTLEEMPERITAYLCA